MHKYHKIQTIYKRDPDTNFKTLLEGQYSVPEFEYLERNEWVFTEKIDGCLHYQQAVMTDEGNIQIGRIVRDRLPVKVLSYNERTGKVEFKSIIHYHKEKRVRDFVCVEIESRLKGNKNKRIVCTDNHLFFSNREWMEAKNLKVGQKIAHLSEEIPQELKQIILGMLLGDASIYRPSDKTRGFTFRHSIEQSGYFDYKAKLFGSLFRENSPGFGGYEGSREQRRGSSIVNRAISDLIIGCCEEDEQKKIGMEWVEKLTPLSLAFWYMDDGSCAFTNQQKPRIRLATNGFTKEEVDLLACNLFRKYGINTTVADYKGWTLTLSADSTELFFSLIFPYICDSMKYKLPEKYRDFKCVLQEKTFDSYYDITSTKVVSVSNDLPISKQTQTEFQYDLSIEDNSNYFTTQILVHNTNVRVIWIPQVEGHIDFKQESKLQFRGKTDNAQMPTFLFEKLQETFLKEKFEEHFPDTAVTLYGEGYGARIQKGGGNYIPDGVDFILFDVLIGDWWLKREDVEDLADKFGIKIVPIIDYGDLIDAVDLAKEGFNSEIAQVERLAEGLVLRPKVELKDRSGKRIIAKIKHKDFGEQKWDRRKLI